HLLLLVHCVASPRKSPTLTAQIFDRVIDAASGTIGPRRSSPKTEPQLLQEPLQSLSRAGELYYLGACRRSRVVLWSIRRLPPASSPSGCFATDLDTSTPSYILGPVLEAPRHPGDFTWILDGRR